MKTPFEQAFAAYWREVRAVCPPFLRRRLLRELRGQARLLQREEPTCDVAALREHLGDPTEVAGMFEQAYYEDEERLTRERDHDINVGLILLLSIMLTVLITMVLIRWSSTYAKEHIQYVFHN